MYYELYIDVLFLVNFTMDYILLLTVRKLLRCTASHFRIFAGAMAGAFLTCAAVCLPGQYLWMKFILFHVVINTVMIRTGLKIKEIKKFLQAFCTLYIGAFFLGGVMQYYHRFMRTAGLFLTLAAVSYEIVQGSIYMIGELQKIRSYRCSVTLYMNGIPYTLEALVDTGNHLCDPLTGGPVHIVSREALPDAWQGQRVQGIHFIEYHSVGKKSGIIPVLCIEKMFIQGERERWVEAPLLGICEEKVTVNGTYNMILNPDIF